jgi:thiamine-phosphate pyrophosphorylase
MVMTTALESLWRVARKLGRTGPRGKALPPLLFFTDPERTPNPERTLVRLPRGAGVVYRAFGDVKAVATGRRLAVLSRRRGLVFFVGASAALAVAVGADGLHLPQRLSGRAGDIRRLRRRFLVTAAAHDLPAALRAKHAGVRALVVSSVFPSDSPTAGRPLGPRRLAALIRRLNAPVYALGGVNAATVLRLGRTGAIGVAGVGGLAG